MLFAFFCQTGLFGRSCQRLCEHKAKACCPAVCQSARVLLLPLCPGWHPVPCGVLPGMLRVICHFYTGSSWWWGIPWGKGRWWGKRTSSPWSKHMSSTLASLQQEFGKRILNRVLMWRGENRYMGCMSLSPLLPHWDDPGRCSWERGTGAAAAPCLLPVPVAPKEGPKAEARGSGKTEQTERN